MPKRKLAASTAIDFARYEKLVADSPDDFFDAEETKRRMDETMSRVMGRPATMNMKTGQNLQEPFLSEDELKARGYPCDPGFE